MRRMCARTARWFMARKIAIESEEGRERTPILTTSTIKCKFFAIRLTSEGRIDIKAGDDAWAAAGMAAPDRPKGGGLGALLQRGGDHRQGHRRLPRGAAQGHGLCLRQQLHRPHKIGR